MSGLPGTRTQQLVLIVDNDASARSALANSLRESHFEVTEAASGSEAIDLFQKATPDLVILAERMPELDGYQACAALRGLPNGRHSPILMIVEDESSDSPRRAFDAGVTDFTGKPIDPVKLARHIPFMLRPGAARADEVSGSSIRALFIDRLRNAISHADRRGRKVATMMLAVTDFRQVTDSLGYDAGVAVFAEVIRRLRHVVRVHDDVSGAVRGNESNVSGWGGGEVLLSVVDLASGGDASGVASRIIEALKPPVHHSGRDLFLTCRMGISLFPDDSKDPNELLQCAAVALSKARGATRDPFAFFSPSMNDQAKARLGLEASLRSALGTDEITAHYQPIVDARAGCIVGAEALGRWFHPRIGAVKPDQFVPIAERLGLINELNMRLMQSICEQLLLWRRNDLPSMYVSVNISGKQFRDPGLAKSLISSAKRSGVSPEAFVLEVTEGALIDNLVQGERTLSELKSFGFRIAIDDFGTGYSSLSYLKRFPVDILKIDRSFIQGIGSSERDRVMVTGVVFLAHGLGVETVAEGIETVEQRDLLLACGCELMQGYLFARPMPAEDLTSFLVRTGGSIVDEMPHPGFDQSDPAANAALRRVIELNRRQTIRPVIPSHGAPRNGGHPSQPVAAQGKRPLGTRSSGSRSSFKARRGSKQS
jgi:diguanylate cyclase (GGDEF)-like protein